MGQYYLTINLDKKEFIHPHKFDDGMKLREFGSSGGGTMFGLAMLLSDGNGRGGGDIDSDSPLVGSWAGDRVIVSGDYADPNRFVTAEDLVQYANSVGAAVEGANLYCIASELFVDISAKVIEALSPSRKVIRETLMPSFTNETDEYHLKEFSDGDFECSCPAFKYGGGRPCKHIDFWQNYRNRRIK